MEMSSARMPRRSASRVGAAGRAPEGPAVWAANAADRDPAAGEADAEGCGGSDGEVGEAAGAHAAKTQTPRTLEDRRMGWALWSSSKRWAELAWELARPEGTTSITSQVMATRLVWT